MDSAMTNTATQFTVPAVAKAVAADDPGPRADHPGRTALHLRRDPRAVGPSRRIPAVAWAGLPHRAVCPWRPRGGTGSLGLYAYNGNEFVEALLGAFAARVAPFNVNFRYVKSELQYLLADSGATALIYHAAFAPRVAEVLARPSRTASPHSDRRRLRQRLARRRRGLRELPSNRRRRHRRCSTRLTICTSSTPVARPECRKVCCGASTTSS